MTKIVNWIARNKINSLILLTPISVVIFLVVWFLCNPVGMITEWSARALSYVVAGTIGLAVLKAFTSRFVRIVRELVPEVSRLSWILRMLRIEAPSTPRPGRVGRLPAIGASGEWVAQDNPGLEVLRGYISNEATLLKSTITKMQRENKVSHHILKGDTSSGKRSILWRLSETYRGDAGTNTNVEIFDCSTVPTLHLHRDFLWFLASTFGGYPSRSDPPQYARNPPALTAQPDEAFVTSEFQEGIRNAEARTVIILADIHKILDKPDPAARDSSGEADRLSCIEALQILFKQKHVSIVASTSASSHSVEIDNIVSGSIVLQCGEQNDARGSYIQAISQFSQDKLPGEKFHRFDDVRLACSVLAQLDAQERTALLDKISDANDSVVSKILLDTAVYIGVKKFEEDLRPSGLSIDRPTIEVLFRSAIFSQSFFEWPLSGRDIRKIWATALGSTSDNIGLTVVDVTNQLRRILINLGLLNEIHLREALHLSLYLQAPAVRKYCQEHSRIWAAAAQMDEVTEKRIGDLRLQLAQDYQPQLATPFSRHLSGPMFRWIGDLSGLFREHDGIQSCIIPLSADTASVLFPTWNSGSENQFRLISYTWARHGGRRVSEVAFILSDSEVPWKTIWRVRIHIDSRQGAGSDVLRSIEALVGEIYYVEGDAYRCGPGGVIEAIVRVKDERLLPDAARQNLERRLQTSREARPFVTITPYLEEEVATELTAQLERASAISLVSDWGGLGGGVGLPALVIQAPSLDLVRARLSHLTGSAGETPSSVEFQCYVSPTAGQAVLVLTNRSIGGQATIYLWSEAGEATKPRATGSEIARRLMDVASDMDINLLAVRPLSEFGCRAEFAEAPEDVASVCIQLRDGLSAAADLGTIQLSLIGTSSPFDSQGLMENAVAAIQPEIYHRVMRRHLFLAEADAAIITHATREVCRLESRDLPYRALEIGAGTGALSEKLIAAGISRLDLVEPHQTLFDYWKTRSKPEAFQGTNFETTIEKFADNFDGELYDIVIAQGVYHHFMPDLELADDGRPAAIVEHRLNSLARCASLVRPGGVLLLSDEFVCQYEDEVQRRHNLDRWYECVIARAHVDHLPELAQMEQLFWRSDREGSGEYKVSREVIEDQIAILPDKPFVIESRTDFGFTADCPGGFSIYCLRRRLMDE